MKTSTVFISIITVSLLSLSCKDAGANPDFSGVSDPYARWKAYDLSNYEMIQSLTCFCAYRGPYRVIVRSNRVTSVIDVTDGSILPPSRVQWVKTVDELFAIVRSIDPTAVAHFSVEYDRRYGFPSFYVDPDANVADEEYGYSIRDLTR
jgi:hypothetical protein